MRSALRHCLSRIPTIRKPDPVEIAAITIPVLVEVVAVTLFIAACMVGMIVLATPVPV